MPKRMTRRERSCRQFVGPYRSRRDHQVTVALVQAGKSLARSRLRETQASETIRIGDEFGKLPNFPQDRKEKCDELRLTTQTQDRMLALFSARRNSGRRFSGLSTVGSTTCFSRLARISSRFRLRAYRSARFQERNLPAKFIW